MDVDHFSKFFGSQVLYLEGRTHPINIHHRKSFYFWVQNRVHLECCAFLAVNLSQISNGLEHMISRDRDRNRRYSFWNQLVPSALLNCLKSKPVRKPSRRTLLYDVHEITGNFEHIKTFWSLENYDDYIGATLSTILSLHSKLPIAESFLVFLTGQDEIEGKGFMCRYDIPDIQSVIVRRYFEPL